MEKFQNTGIRFPLETSMCIIYYSQSHNNVIQVLNCYQIMGYNICKTSAFSNNRKERVGLKIMRVIIKFYICTNGLPNNV